MTLYKDDNMTDWEKERKKKAWKSAWQNFFKDKNLI